MVSIFTHITTNLLLITLIYRTLNVNISIKDLFIHSVFTILPDVLSKFIKEEITHSIIIPMVLIPFGTISISYFLHLYLDGYTLFGVKLLYPLSKKSIYFLPLEYRIEDNSKLDYSIGLFFSMLFLYAYFG